MPNLVASALVRSSSDDEPCRRGGSGRGACASPSGAPRRLVDLLLGGQSPCRPGSRRGASCSPAAAPAEPVAAASSAACSRSRTSLTPPSLGSSRGVARRCADSTVGRGVDSSMTGRSRRRRRSRSARRSSACRPRPGRTGSRSPRRGRRSDRGRCSRNRRSPCRRWVRSRSSRRCRRARGRRRTTSIAGGSPLRVATRPRPDSYRRAALRITSSGAARPVQSSNESAACQTSMVKPSIARAPVARARSSRHRRPLSVDHVEHDVVTQDVIDQNAPAL